MPVEITMPQLSDTMTEGTLVKWLKKEGDKIKAGEIVAEVETDKATMEMESFDGGTLAHVLIKEGEKAPVGAKLAVLATSKEDPAEIKAKYGNAKPAAVGSAVAPAVAQAKIQRVGADKPASSVATLEQASSGEIHDPTDNLHGATRQHMEPVVAKSETNGNGHGGEHLRVSPLAKRIAADGNIPLNEITGSGPGGRIIQRDVLAYQPKEKPVTAPSSVTAGPIVAGEKQVIAMTKMRTAIASALQKSKQTVPHFYASIDIDVEDLTKLRERMNQRLEKEKVRLSIADFITKAVVFSLSKHPILNARFDATKNEITRYSDVNLGIAVAVPDGLIVPVLRAVNRMGLKEIRQRSADLIGRARGQKLRREEQTEGTFTISSLGTMGIREFNAIINPPEVGILAIGSAEKRAVVKGDAIVIRTMLTVTLSADHRVVDGAVAAEFLQTLKQTMEEPGMMLI